jgi:hypothetical protein
MDSVPVMPLTVRTCMVSVAGVAPAVYVTVNCPFVSVIPVKTLSVPREGAMKVRV